MEKDSGLIEGERQRAQADEPENRIPPCVQGLCKRRAAVAGSAQP